ncbi:hypothetical protein Tco_0041715, partial [Tanacetum coccineum]
MGLTTPSHSLTILSLSIKPQPNPPWLKEALLLVDVTCLIPIGIGWLLWYQGFRAEGQLI